MDLNRFLPPLPPPPFATAGEVIAEALPALSPARRITVPDWAADGRRLDTLTYRGPWQNEFAPYLVEPSRMATSRRFGAIVFVGPARTVKTDALVLNTIGHRIECMPRNMLIVAPTQEAARGFSIEKVDPFIRLNRNLTDRLLKVRNADAIHAKRFAGNMRLRIGWPVISQLSMLDIPDVLLTDYDRMPADVGGEGNPFDLARKRNQQFGTLGKTIVESSPGRPITNDDWRASTPHEAPPTQGDGEKANILGLFNRGTRGKRYWECPACHEAFEPLFRHLHCEEKGSPGERAKTVEMVCPECGHCIAPDRKLELDRDGFWLHETDDGELVGIDDDAIRETDIVSYWCEGPVAALQDWQQLMLRHYQAEEEFRSTGDEQSLKTTVNVDQGRPYRPQALTIGEGLNAETLKALADDYPLKVAPSGVRFITLQVDVQGNRFVAAASAWGVGLERWLIDRMDIVNPPAGAPNAADRAIDPAKYSEDWERLFELLDRPYAVADEKSVLLPRALVVDMGGASGVTANAYRFLREARKRGHGHRVFLVKGHGGDRDRAVLREPEKMLGNRRLRRTDIRIIFAGTDPLKDEVTMALMRKDDGPGKAHLPAELPENIFDEFCAEQRLEKGWQPKKSGLRNEALDQEVYGKALAIVLGAEKIDWDSPPEWARPVRENNYAQHAAGADAPAPVNRPGRRVRSRGIG